MTIEVESMRGRVLSLVAGLLIVAAAMSGASAQGLVEGRQYARMNPGQAVETGKKIEVIEFFSYGCPHCAEFEPYVQDWLKTQPADVAFRRIPVMFQPRWVDLAKVYYTLDALGEEAKLSPEVFSAIHGKGIALWEPAKFFDWAASKGLDRKKVEDMYNSFAINGKINRAKQQAQQYGVQSVPLIIVDGKYMTEVSMIGSHEQMPTAINALIAKAKSERPKS
jgi:protein dithiol oxidoreductase (disulfide-forming)